MTAIRKTYECRHDSKFKWKEINTYSALSAAEEYAEMMGLKNKEIISIKRYGKYHVSVTEEYYIYKIKEKRLWNNKKKVLKH